MSHNKIVIPLLDKRLYVGKNPTEVYSKLAWRLCGEMANYYLERFNEIEKTGIFPDEYLNKKDALRDCQYLCEFFKIQQFALAGNPSINW